MLEDKLLMEMATKVARAEIQRDEALERASRAERLCHARIAGDEETMLETLQIVGIPARDLRDIYRLEDEWHRHGGSDNLLKRLREREALATVVRGVLNDMHDDHESAMMAMERLGLALHQYDGCPVFRSDCSKCRQSVDAERYCDEMTDSGHSSANGLGYG